ALLKIPTNDPPTLYDKKKWSSALHDFLRRCLMMNANERASAEELLQHKFIKGAGKRSITEALVVNSMPLIEQFRMQKRGKHSNPKQQKKKDHHSGRAHNNEKRSSGVTSPNEWQTIIRMDVATIQNQIQSNGSNANGKSANSISTSATTTPTPSYSNTNTPTPAATQTPSHPLLPPHSTKGHITTLPKFDSDNPQFKSSPYFSNENEPLQNWQLFEINKDDNIRSKEWIVRSVLEPSNLDTLTIDQFLPENPGREQLEALKQALISAQKRDQDILQQHYISVRRQIRERIQNANAKPRTHRTSIDSNNSPKAIQATNSIDKSEKSSTTTTPDNKPRQKEKRTKIVKLDDQNIA
ncbi:hypothetical protein RFI_24281, partial [Reticulomyxa filosa]